MKQSLLKRFWLRACMLVAVILCGAGTAWGETVTKNESFDFTGNTPWVATPNSISSYCGCTFGSRSVAFNVTNTSISNFSNINFSSVTNPSVQITVKGLTNNGTNEYTITLVNSEGEEIGTPVTKTDGLGKGTSSSAAKESTVTLIPVAGATGYRIKMPAKGAIDATSYILTYDEDGTNPLDPSGDETATLTQSNLGLTGSYTTNTEKTIGGITYIFTDLMKNNDNIQAKATSGTIRNYTPYPGDITSVVITHSGDARATTVNGSADGNNWTQVATGSGSITADFAGKGYKFFQITRGSNAAYWTKIDISFSSNSSDLTSPELSFSQTTAEATLGETFTAPILTNGNNVTVTYSSSNEAVATVDASTGAVTLVGAGETTITATFDGNDSYAANSASYTLTVNEAAVEGQLFYESFDKFDGTGGNDNVWSGSIASAEWGDTDNEGWTNVKGSSAKQCAKFGTSSVLGKGATPTISIPSGNATLTFKAAAWAGDATTLKLSVSNGSITPTTVTLKSGEWSEYSITISGTQETIITFEGNATSKSRFFLDEVRIVEAPASAVKAPVISLASGNYLSSQNVTLSCETEGATIKYSTDGETWHDYSSAITISETTTLYVKAVKGEDESTVVSATYTFPVTYNNIAALIAAAPTEDVILTLTDAQVLYVNNKDMYIKDATGAIDFYNCGLEYTAGQILNGTAVVNYVLYKNGLPDITSVDTENSNLTATDGEAIPVEMSAADITLANDMCKLVMVKGNYANKAIDGLLLFDKWNLEEITLDEFTAEVATAVGIVIPYNNEPEIALIVLKEVPVVAAIGTKKYETLQEAFNAANDGETVTLLKDYDATGESMASSARQFVINKSITFDGGGYTLITKQRGIGIGNVNGDVAADIDVTIKNVTVKNLTGARCIDTRGRVNSLTLENATLSTVGTTHVDNNGDYYLQPLTIGGNQSNAATINISNSTIETSEDGSIYYAIITFNPVNMTISNSTIKGWADIYAREANSSAGSAGSTFTIKDGSKLYSKNTNSGSSNAFSAIMINDNNVTVNILDAEINVSATGDQLQGIVSYNENTSSSSVSIGEGCTVNLTGDNAVIAINNANDGHEGRGGISISGGTFNKPLKDVYCADGMIPADLGDGKYSVKVGSYVAQVGEQKFETFAEAVAALTEENNTITLLANITDTYTLAEAQSLNVNLNGCTINVAAPEGYVLQTNIVNGVTSYTSAFVIARVTHCSGWDENGVEEVWSSTNCTTAQEVEQHVSLTICDDFSTDEWYADRIWVYGEVNANLTLGENQYVYISELGENANFTGKVTAAEGYIIVATDVKADFDEIYEREHKSATLYKTVVDPEKAPIRVFDKDGNLKSGYMTLPTLYSPKLADGDVVRLYSDCTYSSSTGRYLPANATLDLNGHTLTNTDGSGIATCSNDGGKTLTIKDSSEEKTGKITCSVANSSVLLAGVHGTLIIEGGNFEAPSNSNKGIFGTIADDAKVIISGGIFNQPVPEEFCAEGYIPTDLGEGKYGVKKYVATPTIFHDEGTYEGAIDVAIAGQGTIMYKLGDGEAQTYTTPIAINATTTVTAWTEKDGFKSSEVSKTFTIVEKAKGAVVEDGYYTIQTNGDKYVNVAGRKTVTLVDDTKSAGTVIRVSADEDGVKVLRSQAVDLPRYAERAMSYVPEIVKEVVKKLAANVDDPIIGEQGADLILDKFNQEFDYHLYLEKTGDAYRIYGRTPSMKPVVDFYAENKELIDGRLLKVEGFVKEVLQKVVDKVGRGQSVVDMFKVKTIWQNMGGTLTEPTDDASTLKFYEEVLSSEKNVWDFAYQTGMLYWEKVKGYLTENAGSLGDYGKYLEKIPHVQPNFKYYIVPSENGVDIISEGNSQITDASTAWTLTKREGFDITFDANLSKNEGKEMYKSLYVDFAYELPKNVKALKVKSVTDAGVAETEEITGVVPAQTPVLLMSTDVENLTKTLALSTADGAAVTNELKGNDWLINKFEINTPELETIFAMLTRLSSSLGEKYEYLKRKNAGTVNNKYFFGLSVPTPTEEGNFKEAFMNGKIKVLTNGEKGLGFYSNFDKNLVGNEVFMFTDDANPIPLTLVGDINRDGLVTIADVTALVNIVLIKVTRENNPNNYDFDAAYVNDDDVITIADVTALVNIILGK